ncbi:MAG: TRAP transporter permease [Alphaproteobacteria bacterium]|nr:TRAP transporter permease [Alphaproteobacteria bacterium]MBU0799295.1 TRAP transporter permease [Alphaproteobacteria bacterium]MBU0887184.1 TRAP transporter permease [Alphaproteobacteria bacterium]MBU1814434.1 TRAP transporter permease [Alphaproteobacteria bacterium]
MTERDNHALPEGTLSKDQINRLVEEYDPESNFRQLIGFAAILVTVMGVLLSLFHVYTAGFGLLNEITHRSIHLAFVLALIYLVFPEQRRARPTVEWPISLGFVTFYLYLAYDMARALEGRGEAEGTWLFVLLIAGVSFLTLPFKFLGTERNRIPWRDWIMAIVAASVSLYFVVFFDEIFIARVGSPIGQDYMMGVLAIIMVVEATRRTMGLSLPVIGVICLLYGMLGPYLPGVMGHRGYSILRIVNHIYIGTEGIYGIAVGVVATYVFHFVLFGVLMQLTGLGQLFMNLATIVAGRYSGGAAKVSVVSSGLFGMISGSSIANTVTTGALTIPLMKRSGFSSRFAGAVEASASCGGQITPPIMGASAFVMAEMLGVPYNHLILIAIFPAIFHYFAMLVMVHLEAKRLGLSGMDRRYIPIFTEVISRSWHLLIPLVAMVTLLLMQYTPFLAAFWGIILTVVCGYLPLILRPMGFKSLDPSSALKPRQLIEGFELGAKYALGIGAACACVGFILGIATLSGIGFKFSGAVLQLATSAAETVLAFDFTGWIGQQGVTLFFALVFIAMACILMGAGIPTTPTYIILASIAAPALHDLGVPLLVTHFFVFYYGVLADVTPPVALAAYAGAGIAGSEPMRTGVTAFRLSMGKALVPFMFVYAPSMLLVDFTWLEFTQAMLSGLLSVLCLSVAYIGHFRAAVSRWMKIVLSVAGLLLVFNDLRGILIGTVLAVLVLGSNWLAGAKQARSG